MWTTRIRLAQRLLAALMLAWMCKAEDVTVRIISAKSGRAMVEQHVHLDILAPGPTELRNPFREWMYTDAAGLATFHVPFPMPGNAILYVAGLMDYCSPAMYHPHEVLQTGVDRVSRCVSRPPIEEVHGAATARRNRHLHRGVFTLGAVAIFSVALLSVEPRHGKPLNGGDGLR